MLEPIISNLRGHVYQCPLCYAKGHICGICNDEKEIIFPFELDSTSVCQSSLFFCFDSKQIIFILSLLDCQSCYHFQCHEHSNYQCPKCQRTKNRM